MSSIKTYIKMNIDEYNCLTTFKIHHNATIDLNTVSTDPLVIFPKLNLMVFF